MASTTGLAASSSRIRSVLVRASAVVGIAGGLICLVAVDTAVAVRQSTEYVLPQLPLAPGGGLSGEISIAPADRPLTPYIAVRDLQNACQHACADGAPRLSDLLRIQITAPDGTSWTEPLVSLRWITALPGGDLSSSSATRVYRVVAKLPRTTGNSGEGLSTSFELEWGLMDGSGRRVTHVLGESFTRKELPFTGSDVLLEVAAAASLVAIGGMLIRRSTTS